MDKYFEHSRLGDGATRDEELAQRCLECWNGWRGFREERNRCKRYTYGEQWMDLVEDRGVRMREEDFIRSQGNMPLKNNLIRRLVRNVLGVFRNRYTPSQDNSLRDVELMNRLEEMYARTMEEFLISGLAVHKKWFGRRAGCVGCQTDAISPDMFFADLGSRDFRGIDLSLIGEMHEMRFEDLVASFVRTDGDLLRLRELYALGAHESSREGCVVIEAWQRCPVVRYLCHHRISGRWHKMDLKEIGEITNPTEYEIHRIVDEQWRFTFMTRDGDILARGVSPYRHGSHPYVMKAYPFIDGEIHSFVSDVIDQQKLTNRLISMYDWILRASAKGVLLFPEGALPEGVDMDDVAEEWSRFNGVIVYRPRAGVPLPQQVSSKSADIGITELLEIQMKMMEDISGVNGALQGKLDSNSMSGTLYNQQTQNSLTALADLMKSFDDFIQEARKKDISNVHQFRVNLLKFVNAGVADVPQVSSCR